MTLPSRSTPVVSVGVLVLATGCQAILDLPEKVTAFRWCLDAEPATGRLASNGGVTPIHHPETHTWMRGCKCYCPHEHDIMVRGAAGMLTPDTLDETFYDNEVTLLRSRAELACNDRVSQLQTQLGTILEFDGPPTVSCAEAVADEQPYYTTECVLDEDICPPIPDGGGGGGGGGGGSGTDGGDDTEDPATDDAADTTGLGDDSTGTTSGGMGGAMVYGLDSWSSVIDCPTADRCDIEATFVDELLADLSLLEADAIMMGTSTTTDGHPGFVFAKLGADSLPAALGFSTGDLLWKIEDIELRDFASMGRAFEELSQARELTVTLDRDGQRLQRTVRQVSQVGEP